MTDQLAVLHPTVPNTVEALEALTAAETAPVVLLGTSTEHGIHRSGSVYVAVSYNAECWTCTGVLGEVETDFLTEKLGVPEWTIIYQPEEEMPIVSKNGYGVADYKDSTMWWKNNTPDNNYIPGEATPALREYFLTQLGMWFDEETGCGVINTHEGYFYVVYSGTVVKRVPGDSYGDIFQQALDNYTKCALPPQTPPQAGEIKYPNGYTAIAHAVAVGDEVRLYEVGTIDAPPLLDVFPRTLIADSGF